MAVLRLFVVKSTFYFLPGAFSVYGTVAQASSLSTCLGKEGSVQLRPALKKPRISLGSDLQAVGPEAGDTGYCPL